MRGVKGSQVPGDYRCARGAHRGRVPAVFGAGPEDELEGTGPFARQGGKEGGYVGN